MDFVFFVLVLERCMRKGVLINNDKVFVMLNCKKNGIGFSIFFI